MKYLIQVVIFISGILACIWLVHLGMSVIDVTIDADIFKILSIILLYLLSHMLRMARLAYLTLDQREKMPKLLLAHAIMSFPAAILPFKLGELLRIGSFYVVFDGHQKALAIWLIERVGDVLTLIIFILLLGMMGVSVPAGIRNTFIAFSIISVLALFALYSLSHTFVFLNRYLVLTSSSERGFRLLQISHILRRFELAIRDCLRGRMAAFCLMSALVWISEILAYSCYIASISEGEAISDSSFAFGLFASLSNQIKSANQGFGIYQSLSLACLTLAGVIVFFVFHYIKKGTKTR